MTTALLQPPFLPSFSTSLAIPANLAGCVPDFQYTTKTLPCLTCVPPRFDYVSVSPFAYCIHLPRVYIDALELHSQSSRSCNSSLCKAYTKSGRPKKKPPIEASDDKSTFTFSFPSSSSSSGLVRQGERREHPQTPEKEKEKEKENQKPAKKTTK